MSFVYLHYLRHFRKHTQIQLKIGKSFEGFKAGVWVVQKIYNYDSLLKTPPLYHLHGGKQASKTLCCGGFLNFDHKSLILITEKLLIPITKYHKLNGSFVVIKTILV